MFPKLFGGNEQVQQVAAEERDRDFSREQQRIDAATKDDETYMVSQESKADLLRWQQDLDDELFSLIEMMLGRRKHQNENGELVWKKVAEPICNRKFVIQIVIPQCKSFMTRNMINSNWSEKIILTRLKITSNTIVDAMSDGWDTYDINFTNNDAILNQIKTTIIAGAYRALNGWTKKIDSTMIKRIESMTEKEKIQVNEGIFGGMFKSG